MGEKRFAINKRLMRHLHFHAGAELYSCRHCSKSFMTHHQRRRHLLESHNEGNWFTCHVCEKKFHDQSSYKRHLLGHEHVKPYVCAECPKSFCTACELKRHQAVHSDIRQFGCILCDQSFKRKDYAVSHFKKCLLKMGKGSGLENLFAQCL